MTTTRPVAVVVALLAAAGLVVSALALWPEPETTPGSAPTSAPVATRVASPDTARETATGPGSSATAPSSSTSPVPRSDASLSSGRGVRAVRPTRVLLGEVDIDARVRQVGVAEDGQMELPDDPRVMGWYRFGPAPGQPGSAVLAGHLDSRRFGLGPLARLRDAEVGDPVEVRLSDGSTASYRVRSIERFDRQGLPSALFARNGPHVLRVVTCGGEYDPDNGGYQQNLVVTAAPVR